MGYTRAGRDIAGRPPGGSWLSRTCCVPGCPSCRRARHRAQPAPRASSRSCVWRLHQPIFQMRTSEPGEVMPSPVALGHEGAGLDLVPGLHAS